MKRSASSFCPGESYDIKSFLIATAIVFGVIIVGFFSYVGYKVSYSMAASDEAKIIERKVNDRLNHM